MRGWSWHYVARRLAAMLLVLVGITGLAFVICRVAPGDPAQTILSREMGRPPTRAEVLAFDHLLRLDKSVPAQYLDWLGGALHGDLGSSYQTGNSVTGVIASRLPATLRLTSAALCIAVLLSVPLGIWAALRASRWPDSLTRVVSVGSAAFPSFWVGYLLIIVFAVRLAVLPAQGDAGRGALVLPAVTLAIAIIGVPIRLVRASVLEVLGQDYVRTARGMGLSQRRVIRRHVLRNALSPVVTYLGITLGFLLSGAVVIETVFAWPGLGLAVTDAIHARDYPVVQGFVVFTGALFVVVNLMVDLSYRLLDPRVRLGAAAGKGAHG